MDTVQLAATPREAGKKHARAARRNHEVPCVLYGAGIDTPLTFQVPELALRDLIYTPETRTATISLGGATHTALLKSVVMHPVTDRPYHADFIALASGATVRVALPLRFVGQAPATRSGLVINEVLHEIEVEGEPQNLPGHLDVDLSGLEGVHDAVRVSDLTLPAGLTTSLDADTTVVAVVPPMAEEPEAGADAAAEA